MKLDSAFELVRDFHSRFGHPVGEKPGMLTEERGRARAAWMREEIDEFLSASDLTEQADAMVDLIYFALGTLVEMGVRPEKLFEIVHTANMEKLWPDGAPRFRDDGKTIKPPTWTDPALALQGEIERQRRS